MDDTTEAAVDAAPEVELTANEAIKANAALSGAKLTALHFDIEPYLLAQWSSDLNGTAASAVQAATSRPSRNWCGRVSR